MTLASESIFRIYNEMRYVIGVPHLLVLMDGQLLLSFSSWSVIVVASQSSDGPKYWMAPG